MDNEMLDLYTDFLISSFSYTTATSLSRMLDLKVSHDKITRFLSKELYTPKDFWKLTKPIVKEFEEEDGAIAIDNTILDKTYTDENEIICWHYDHSKGKNIKGVNIMSCLYCTESTKIPFSFEIIKKDICYIDEESGKEKRKSSKTMNEIFREMVKNAHRNIKKFKYFLSDNWFSSSENMELINEINKYFIFALKNNRLIALSYKDKKEGKFKKISIIDLEQNHVYQCYLKGVEFPLLVVKQVFKNKDGSEGVLYLVSNDLSLDFNGMTTIYKKRWKVEEYHESIKQNTGLGKSPTRTMMTQSNHFFASIYAFVKLETLSRMKQMNHYLLKSRLYLNAIKESYKTLNELKFSV